MKINFVTADVGMGKTSECINRALKLQEEGLQSLIIVPEQASSATEMLMLKISDTKSMLYSNVLSFNRLAFFILKETGYKYNGVIDDVTKIMILRKVVDDLSSEFIFYKSNSYNLGFIEKLSSTIMEFYSYEISPDTISQIIDNVESKNNSTIMQNKLQDIKLIYKEFVDRINKQYILKDEMLDILYSQIKKSEYLKKVDLYIDGFLNLTPQEYRVVYELCEVCKSVTFSVTMDNKYTVEQLISMHLDEMDFYYEPKKYMYNVTNKLQSQGASFSDVHYISTSDYVKDYADDIKFIRYNYKSNNKKYKGKSENVKIYKVDNKYDELNVVASSIYENVMNNNIRYKDIVIACADLPNYEYVIKGVFEQYGIPFFVDTKKSIMQHKAVELLRATIDVYVKNWSYESVFRLLKTNMYGISDEEIYNIENYVIAYDIKGYKWKYGVWQYGSNAGFNVDEINMTKNTFIDKIQAFGMDINNNKNQTFTVRQLCEKLYNYMEYVGLPNIINDMIDKASDNSIDKSEHSQIWQKIIGLLDNMVDTMGEVKVTLLEFSNIFDAGVSSIEMGFIPSYHDRIMIVDFVRSKFDICKHVYIIGANDGNIPKVFDNVGLFTDIERDNIENQGVQLANSTIANAYTQNLSIYSLLTKSREKIYITYSASTLQNKQLYPSKIIDKLCAMLSIKVEKGVITYAPRKIGTVTVGQTLRNINTASLYDTTVLQWYIDNSQKNEIFKLKKIINNEFTKTYLNKSIVEDLYNNELVTGISRLEKYVQCPYSFYLEQILKIRERKEYKVTQIEFGNLFHDLLELYIKDVIDNKVDMGNITDADISVFIQDNIDKCLHKLQNDVLTSSSRYEFYLDRIIQITTVSIKALIYHINNGNFAPKGAEIEFKKGDVINSIVINIDDKRRIILNGKIDRIDILDDNGNAYVKIIDYKSGNKQFELLDVYYGLQLQLMAYMDTIIKNKDKVFMNEFDAVVEGGVFYFNIKNPIVKSNEILNSEEIYQLILDEFKMSGFVNSDETVVYNMDKNIKPMAGSRIIPVSLKKDGTTDKHSKVLNKEQFELVRNYTTKKINDIGKDILDGNIEVRPIKNKDFVGCEYCDYESICKINIRTNKDKYNNTSKLRKDEILKKMDDELNDKLINRKEV